MTPTIHGALDAQGRCRHWSSPVDVLAIRPPCCEGFWACHACHEEHAHHAMARWPTDAGEVEALLCGACQQRFSIDVYLGDTDHCPSCGQAFNPGCRDHHPLYFEGTPSKTIGPQGELRTGARADLAEKG